MQAGDGLSVAQCGRIRAAQVGGDYDGAELRWDIHVSVSSSLNIRLGGVRGSDTNHGHL
jgi:hypothetical protein